MQIINDTELLELRGKLLGSLLYFTQFFYKLRTGREFNLSQPVGRESHFITLSKHLTKIYKGELKNIVINIPPRHGKTEMLVHFIAWTLAKHPDSNYIYVSYAHSLAKKQTQTIREIIQLPLYRKLFGIEIKSSSKAKDNFELIQGGCVYGAGAGGVVTGRGAGIKDNIRWGGAVVIDDIHKPSEATSDTIRTAINDWFYNTLQSRINSIITPIIFIGQRVHEDDLPANLLTNNSFSSIILPALDVHGHVLYPEYLPKEKLLEMEETGRYEFAAQYQQNPQPAGGGLFKPSDFVILPEEPEILETFITVDTAETSKNYNDATVFSFWGLYRIRNNFGLTTQFGLHWLDCYELRIEPKDLQQEFITFYNECCLHKIKPTLIGIEKKSTGVTLSSVISDFRGLMVVNIERSSASEPKCDRFLQMQPHVAKKLISFTEGRGHVQRCIEHCRKITANNSHRHDDICDTLYDAVKIALIDNTIRHRYEHTNKSNEIVDNLARKFHNSLTLQNNAYKAKNLWRR
jgi:predicted phage terminase large subunit-like protein